jgi:uroporphyrinogen-III synthase
MNRLAGQRVVVTRASHQAEELARPLRELGAEVILLPMLSITPPEDAKPLHEAAQRIDSYDWIVFSSANAVDAVAAHLAAGQLIPKARVAVVGVGTKIAVERIGWRVAIVPERFVAESLVEAMSQLDLRGRRILIPSAAISRDILPQAFANLGACVEVVEAYSNNLTEEDRQRARDFFAKPVSPDWVTFTSSSAVDHLVQAVGAAALIPLQIASIGPITSATVRKYGLSVAVEPAEHTVQGLVASMAEPR